MPEKTPNRYLMSQAVSSLKIKLRLVQDLGMPGEGCWFLANRTSGSGDRPLGSEGVGLLEELSWPRKVRYRHPEAEV